MGFHFPIKSFIGSNLAFVTIARSFFIFKTTKDMNHPVIPFYNYLYFKKLTMRSTSFHLRTGQSLAFFDILIIFRLNVNAYTVIFSIFSVILFSAIVIHIISTPAQSANKKDHVKKFFNFQ